MAKKQTAEVYTENIVVPLNTLVHNDANPRTIKDKRFADLKQSLQEFPEMKKLREIIVDENLLILAGDKRARALKDLQYSDVEVKQVFNLSEEKKLRFIAIDNEHWGDWDADVIADQWDPELMKDWGIESVRFGGFDDAAKDETKPERKPKRVLCPCGCGEVFEVKGNEFVEE